MAVAVYSVERVVAATKNVARGFAEKRSESSGAEGGNYQLSDSATLVSLRETCGDSWKDRVNGFR